MSSDRKAAIWIAGLVVFGVFLHLLSSILLPFVVGMAIAYFLDPVADRLEDKGLSRTAATCVILLAFFIAAVALLLLLIPLLQNQIVEFVKLLPGILEAVHKNAQVYLEKWRADLPPQLLDNAREAAGNYAGKIADWVSRVVVQVWSGGVALFNILSLVIITPVVAFYLLRDWDLITAKVDTWLPRSNVKTFREQALAIDETVAGFVRGQSTVCLVLAAFYGIALTVIGLKSGLLVGVGAGFISFIPYVGAATGMIVGVGIAIFQFPEITTVLIVAGVFLVGQTLESYVLTPRLVGDRVGLHPVWIIFALLAGGALMGFTGVLIAVPTAAIIGVLVRFSLDQYMESELYTGKSSGDKGGTST